MKRLQFTEALVQQLRPLLAQSFLDELGNLKAGIVEFRPEIEELLDMDALEAGGWNFNDLEWPLQNGKSVSEVVRLIARNSFFERDLIKMLSLFKTSEEGLYTRQDGKAFDSFILLLIPPIEFVINLLNSNYLSLFECIFLVGYANDKEFIIYDSDDIVSHALAAGIIEPRDPANFLRFSELPEKRFDGSRRLPDLSWMLTFDEAEQWANNSFGLRLLELRDALPEKQGSKQSSVNRNNADDQEIKESEIYKLLRIIGLLAETLANTNHGDLRDKNNDIIFGNGEIGKTGKTNLLYEISTTLDGLEIEKKYGLGNTTLQNTIQAGIDALRKS